MAFSLVSNLGSLESQSRLNVTGAKLNQAIQRLSSGLRINMSGDDAAGLAIANKYRSDISVIGQGVRNANDGLSTLQTIDGGLSNISTLLDRASVLSAQSASDTFTGNRDTLQAELSKVMAEVTRQAQSIGLVSSGVNNKALTTIIGGGSDSFSAAGTNNGVAIDLSGAGNRVDATSLGLGSLNIGLAGGSVTAASTPITSLTGAETLTFKTADAAGTLTTFNVVLATNDTGTMVVDKINNDVTAKAAGLVASLDSAGKLKISSSGFFTVKSSLTAAATTTGIANTETVSSAAANVALTGFDATAAGSQAFDFTIGNSGTMIRVDVTTIIADDATATADKVVAAVNANSTLKAAGIYAIKSDATSGVKIVSTKTSFGLLVEAPSVVASQAVTATVGAQTVTAGVAGGGSDGARAALDSLKAAIATLGSVQGIVGAGENRLQQAVDLATSQITNFQAAESRVRDADVAQEASSMSRLTVLQQAGVAALAQANQSSQAVLSLLR